MTKQTMSIIGMGGVNLDRCTDLHVIRNVILMSKSYNYGVFRYNVLQYAEAIDDSFLLMLYII